MGAKNGQNGRQKGGQTLQTLIGRFTNFTPLNTPINQVLMLIKDDGALAFPGKLKGDPSKRSRVNIADSTAITATTHPNAMT